MLHITNGDSVAETLHAAGIEGDVAISADVLHEGPCLTSSDPGEYRETRARYLADAGYAGYDEALEALVHADAALHAARHHDEIVLWFEHDLFDQLLLVRLLAWFARHGTGTAQLRIICIGRYPGIPRFDGLGQLSPSQLRDLLPQRVPVTAAQLALGREAWARFGENDPRRFAELAADDPALPFLAGAVRRQLEEYPSTRNGLARTERQALAAIAAGAPDLPAAYRSNQEMEERVFMGDLTFYAAVRRLATAGLPLVSLDPPGDRVSPTRQSVSLTTFGAEVLAGASDHVRVNGIDRWIGGVQLRGRASRWRWNEHEARLEGPI